MILGDSDKVRCFHCDVLLYNWEPEDNPWVEHAKWYPGCQYVRLVKGDKFVEDVKNGKPAEDAILQTPAVMAVLEAGYTVEAVQRAMHTLKTKEGKISKSGDRVYGKMKSAH